MVSYGFKSVNNAHNWCDYTIELILMSRSLLRLSERQTSSQNNCFPGARARDSPKRRRHTRPCSILHFCIYQPIHSWTARYFVVLSRSPIRSKCVILALLVDRQVLIISAWPSPLNSCPHLAVALLTQALYCFRAAVLTKSKSAVVLIMMVQPIFGSWNIFS